MADSSFEALAAYGSLRPGGANHWVVKNFAGEWVAGTVRGWAFEVTWGPAEGYDGFIADANGNEVAVDVLVSEVLPKHWHEVDDFEGDGYRRIPIEVTLNSGAVVSAQIYETITEAD